MNGHHEDDSILYDEETEMMCDLFIGNEKCAEEFNSGRNEELVNESINEAIERSDLCGKSENGKAKSLSKAIMNGTKNKNNTSLNEKINTCYKYISKGAGQGIGMNISYVKENLKKEGVELLSDSIPNNQTQLKMRYNGNEFTMTWKQWQTGMRPQCIYEDKRTRYVCHKGRKYYSEILYAKV